MLAKTIYIKLRRDVHIFPQGITLEVAQTDSKIGENGSSEGYSIPDIGDGSPGIIPFDAADISKNEASPADAYLGPCLLTKVSNFYQDPEKDNATGIASIGIVKAEKIQLIHYGDSQQIVFHMPQYAYDAGLFRLTDSVTGKIIEEVPVKACLNGSTMMLINTLAYKPGVYTIEASWPDGWTHQLIFIKFQEGFDCVKKVDLPQVNYTQDGRGGKIIYRDGPVTIDFDWEFAAGNAVAFFYIPQEANWEAQTKTPLSRRTDIISFVASQIIKDQAPGCHFEIHFDSVDILR